MNDGKFLYGTVGLIFGIVLTWIFAVSAVNGNNMGMMRMMGMGSSSMMTNSIDEHFIDQMIPHHEDAITMANIALEKAEHQEIKDLAQNIIRSQSQEIDQMKKWDKKWFSPTSLIPKVLAHDNGHGSMHMGMMGDRTDIEELKSAQPFDKAFIEKMIPHHQMAVVMAQMLKNTSNRSEMKQLADDIIEVQNNEIQQMRSWYSHWYK